MTWVIRLLVAGFAALFLIIGVRAMLDPQTIITQFELGMQNATGVSAIRADMGAFFIGTGLAAIVGLFPGKRQWLLGAAAMVALAFTGRVIGLMSDGLTANIAQSMIIEAISIALLVASFAILSPRRRQELAEQKAAELERQRAASEPEYTEANREPPSTTYNPAATQNDLDAQRDRDLAQPIV
jgi:hypothetical protein